MPNPQSPISDRLIWLPSAKGKYNTKEGYERIRQASKGTAIQYEQTKMEMWKKLWQWKRPIPRVKTFLWRVIHEGLPTMQSLSRRIPTINPKFLRCNMKNEFNMHLLFYCPVSRATWHASRLTLRVEELSLDITAAILQVTVQLDPGQITYFCNILWCLWKARNKEMFEGKKRVAAGIQLRWHKWR